MNLTQKGHKHAHRGVIGIESAIVLIAFVIVAAALAFVVLNMGFATTQKAKTSIVSSLGEAGSALEVSGKVIGFADVGDVRLNATAIPIKITSGGNNVDLDDSRVSVKYVSNNVEYNNILGTTCTLTATTYANASLAFDAADALGTCQLTQNPILDDPAPLVTSAIIYWSVRTDTNSILDAGEHAVLAIAYNFDDRPSPFDVIRAEVILPTGATLTVQRDVPILTNLIVDMG